MDYGPVQHIFKTMKFWMHKNQIGVYCILGLGNFAVDRPWFWSQSTNSGVCGPLCYQRSHTCIMRYSSWLQTIDSKQKWKTRYSDTAQNKEDRRIQNIEASPPLTASAKWNQGREKARRADGIFTDHNVYSLRRCVLTFRFLLGSFAIT